MTDDDTSDNQKTEEDVDEDGTDKTEEVQEDEEPPYEPHETEQHETEQQQEEEVDDGTNVTFSPNFAEVDVAPSPANSDSSNSGAKENQGDYDVSIPGAEPTPPPESSPTEYPKIRIKTTGLLKEPLTITEITDDDEHAQNRDNSNNDQKGNDIWSTSLEDPLKLPGTDDILSLFNNNERAKDFGFTTSESEFMPLDRLEDRNRNNAMVKK